MKRDNIHEAMRWIRQAIEDLDAAKYNHKGKKYNVSCFLCHQATEKILKGYLIYKGLETVWGHSISELISECIDFDKDFLSMKKDIVILDKYYIPTRYPNGLPGGIPAEAFNLRESKEAIKNSERAINFILEKMPEIKDKLN